MATAIENNGLGSLNGRTSNDCLVRQEESSAEESLPEIDITINNVVCSFSVRCHLNLKEIATRGTNVIYRRENGMVSMKLRNPYTTASVWSSGKITCTGATSEDSARTAARKYARCLQNLGFKVRFNNFRVVNVLATTSMPFAIKINNFSAKYPKQAEYEPEIHPGVTYRLKEPKATLKIFSTGSITVTAPCVSFVATAIEHIYPLVYEFRKERTKEDELQQELKKLKKNGVRKRKREELYESEEENEEWCQDVKVAAVNDDEEDDDDDDDDHL